MRNIKVLPHRPMTTTPNQYNVQWGDGIYTKLMAMRLHWHMSLMEAGAVLKDRIIHNADGSAILIQLDKTDGRIDFIHTAETIVDSNGVHHNRGFHWEASDSPEQIMAAAPDDCDRFLTKSGKFSYDLENLENRAMQYPDTFHVPSFNQLVGLVKGDFVQLHFRFNGQVERMWVLFDKFEDYELVGTLANDPVDSPYIKHGDVIHFFAHNVGKLLKGDKVFN